MVPGTNCKGSVSLCHPPASSPLSCRPYMPLSVPQSIEPSNPFFSSGSGELWPLCSGHTTLNQSGLVDSPRRHVITEPVSQWAFSSLTVNMGTSDLHKCIKTKVKSKQNKQKQKQSKQLKPRLGDLVLGNPEGALVLLWASFIQRVWRSRQAVTHLDKNNRFVYFLLRQGFFT